MLDGLDAVGTVFSKDSNGNYSPTANYYGHLNDDHVTKDTQDATGTGGSNKDNKTFSDDDGNLDSLKKGTSDDRDEITGLTEHQASIFKELMANGVNVDNGKAIALKFNNNLVQSYFTLIDGDMSHEHAIKACLEKASDHYEH